MRQTAGEKTDNTGDGLVCSLYELVPALIRWPAEDLAPEEKRSPTEDLAPEEKRSPTEDLAPEEKRSAGSATIPPGGTDIQTFCQTGNVLKI